MRRALEPDHDLLGDDEPPRDLVLGMPALMGIFLAVVLICAVCFGFGYSSGHGLHLATAAPEPHPAAPAVKPSPSATQAAPDNPLDAAPHPDAAPSASEPPPELSAAGVPVGKPAPGVTAAPTQPAGTVQPQEAAPHVAIAPPAPSVSRPMPEASTAKPVQPEAAQAQAPAPAATSAAANLNLMVQIAAVTQAADAETLARALRHDGFDAIVRTTTGDPYFHVQVGPFASYDAAKAVRSRLAADGYTAFIRR